MSEYTKFKIEAQADHTAFKVLVKGWFGWKSGFVYTPYFAISYPSEADALTAIYKYQHKFTEELS